MIDPSNGLIIVDRSDACPNMQSDLTSAIQTLCCVCLLTQQSWPSISVIKSFAVIILNMRNASMVCMH